jgi:hypothetical protein
LVGFIHSMTSPSSNTVQQSGRISFVGDCV